LTLNRNDIAGKTGTTNDGMDGWFAGYNGDVVTTVWVGFDQQKSLSEYGADAALPIWIDFMRIALDGKPEHTLSQPPNIVRLGIGMHGFADDGSGVYELFDKNHLPQAETSYADENKENNGDHIEENLNNTPPTSEDELETPSLKVTPETQKDNTALELDKPNLESQDAGDTSKNQEGTRKDEEEVAP
jgi:membrane carboxypeptidase/penicillin-binding protein